VVVRIPTALGYGLFFGLSFASFLYTTRCGKFVVWAGLLVRLGLTGRERVVDLGCGRRAAGVGRFPPRAGVRRPVGRPGSGRRNGTRPGLAFLVRRAVGTHRRGHRDPMRVAAASRSHPGIRPAR